MSAFNQVHVLKAEAGGMEDRHDDQDPGLIVAGAGSTTGDIIRKAATTGLTVPLGTRPSVGTGPWLQGEIGHLARLHGLACDAIVGAIIIGVDSGQILRIGCIPSQHTPADATCPEDETDLLWTMKGAGTNFGIVTSVAFKAYAAPPYLVRNRVIPLDDKLDAQLELRNFGTLAANLPNRNLSADAYLYWEADQLRLGITMFEASTTGAATATPTRIS
jgi:FAD/FMN-containing dehydrogenase